MIDNRTGIGTTAMLLLCIASRGTDAECERVSMMCGDIPTDLVVRYYNLAAAVSGKILEGLAKAVAEPQEVA